MVHFISYERLLGYIEFCDWWGYACNTIYNKLMYLIKWLKFIQGNQKHIPELNFEGQPLIADATWANLLLQMHQLACDFKIQKNHKQVDSISQLTKYGKWLTRSQGATVVKRVWNSLDDIITQFDSGTIPDDEIVDLAFDFQTLILVLLPFFAIGGQRASVYTQFTDSSYELELNPEIDAICFFTPMNEKVPRNRMMPRIPINAEFAELFEFFKTDIRPILLGDSENIAAYFLTRTGLPLSSQVGSTCVQKFIASVYSECSRVGWGAIRRIIPTWLNAELPINDPRNNTFWSLYANLANTSIDILKRNYIRTDDSLQLTETIRTLNEVLWSDDTELIEVRNRVLERVRRTST